MPVVSDGWNRGQPEMLAREVARLQTSCHCLVWLSQLLGTIARAGQRLVGSVSKMMLDRFFACMAGKLTT